MELINIGTSFQIENSQLFFLNIRHFVSIHFPDDVDDYSSARPLQLATDHSALTNFSINEIERINRFKTMKKQIEWICGRLCVKQLINQQSLIPYNEIEIDYEDYGAPFFKERPDYAISISHAGSYAGAALNICNTSAIGLDIERTDRPNMNAFIKVSFTEREMATVTSAADIYTIWTAKEAYLKYIRRGFHETIKNIEFFENELYYKKQKLKLITYTSHLDPTHLYTLVSEQ